MLGWPYLVVIPVTLLAVAVVAALFQRVVMERVIASKGVGVQLVIATLGLAYALKGLVRQSGLGDTPRSLPPLAPTDAIIIGDAVLTQLDLVIFAVAVAVMLLLFCMFRYPRRPRHARRRHESQGGAPDRREPGPHPHAGGALAGLISSVAALLITPKILITPDIGHIAILAYAAAIVGGITSLPGAVVGGFVIGVAENLVGLFISTNAIVVAPFVAIMVVLLLRPQGLLGGKLQVKKV